MKKIALAMICLLTTSLTAEPPVHLEAWKNASVLVKLPRGSGSGVAFKNGTSLFVWTDAHVAEGVEKIETVINPKTGLKAVQVAYDDLQVVREEYLGNRKVGERFVYAEVLRYSDIKRGHDLCLLRVRNPDFVNASVKFSQEVPLSGSEIWHVGSSAGTPGANTVSTGVFSTAGRLRRGGKSDETNGNIYDQVTIPCIAGSSGCGIFNLKGDCIGLITEGYVQDINFITPARRIRQFAVEAKCEWAVDNAIPVPEDAVIFQTPVRQTSVPLPDEWKPAPEKASSWPFRLPFLPIKP